MYNISKRYSHGLAFSLWDFSRSHFRPQHLTANHRITAIEWLRWDGTSWGLFGPNPLLMQGQSHQRGDLKCPCQPASLLLRFFDSLVVLLKLRRLFLRAVCPGPVLANRTPLMDATLCVTKCDPDMGNCCRDGPCWDLGSNDTASTAQFYKSTFFSRSLGREGLLVPFCIQGS